MTTQSGTQFNDPGGHKVAIAVIVTIGVVVAGLGITALVMLLGNHGAAPAPTPTPMAGQAFQVKTVDGAGEAPAMATGVATDVTIPNVGVCTYSAYDPETKQGNFGPALGHFASANEAIASWAQAMAKDCYLAAIWTTVNEEWSAPEVVAAIANGQAPPDLNAARVKELALKFKEDPKAWQDAITKFFQDNPDMVLMEAPKVAYYSLGVKLGANPGDMPEVTLLADHQNLSQAIMIRKNGQNWVADRLPCRHQPSVPGKPNIVPVPQRQAPPPPSAPPVTRVVSPPPVKTPPPVVVCNNCNPKPPPPCKPGPCGCAPCPPPPPPPPCKPGPCGCAPCPPPPPPPPAPKIPAQDPYPQGNAPQGGGHNDTNGQGDYIPPAEMERPSAAPYTPPPAPDPVWDSPASGGPVYAPDLAPPAASLPPETGTTTTTTSGGEELIVPGYAGGGQAGSPGAGNDPNGANGGDNGGF